MQNNKRDIWCDNVKVIACVLVVLGHFFQSMTKALLMPEGNLYLWFNQTIYYFHVPLFFICSGYLYQKYSKVDSMVAWGNNVLKKALALGIPYFTFSIITWGVKIIFSSSVNTKVGGLFHTLFNAPLSPYWYLYCLFFVFLITPTFRCKKLAIIGLSISLLFKFAIILGAEFNIYAISSVMTNEIWFIFGMCICVFDIDKWMGKLSTIVGLTLSVVFIVGSIAIYMLDIDFKAVSFIMGIVGSAMTLMIICHLFRENIQNGVMGFMARYTMPIFLMHTIFAATLRSVLFKLGISNLLVHIAIGILVSFAGPIVTAKIMSCFTCLDFLLYPCKYFRFRYNIKCENIR